MRIWNERRRREEERAMIRMRQIYALQTSILRIVADLVESRDNITGGHVERTQRYLGILYIAMRRKGLFEEELMDWSEKYTLPSALLHDVGKIVIPDQILMKPGRLTDEEFAIMKTHVNAGAKLIRRMIEDIDISTLHEGGLVQYEGAQFLQDAYIFASCHHEKWDGTGYPCGRAGKGIPLKGRMMALGDVYDALVTRRPYKEPYTHEQAVAIIEDGAGTHFDPALVDVFLSVKDKFASVATASGSDILPIHSPLEYDLRDQVLLCG
ncbi:MAG: HD domain-containing protein [Clostridiales Family XIII bacterium]|jgi:putative two-component system response regulator|nr:HD domain-containing protein [Clostridiales Family XIII bacterium]